MVSIINDPSRRHMATMHTVLFPILSETSKVLRPNSSVEESTKILQSSTTTFSFCSTGLFVH